ncbi:MAG: lipid A deacylase LpxR family protein, partial [Brevundimonas sp.]
NSDRYYTQGLKLSFLSPDLEISVLEDVLRDRVGLGDPVVRTTVGLGQHIYTPEDLLVPVPDPQDRPYAGWAYLSAAAFAYDPGGDDLYSLEVQLGMVGPSAHAGEAQNAVHRRIEVAESLGWDHQLRDEPGLNLYGERRRVMWRADDHSVEVIGVQTLAAGTVETSVGGGLIGRIGYNLHQDFGPQRLRPGSAGADFFDGHGDAFYFFAGLHVRGVVHDVFLDGNVFRDSPSVDRKPLVPELTAGVTWTSGRLLRIPFTQKILPPFRISYAHVWQGEQFVGQNGPLEYGSLTFSFTTSGLAR